MLVVACDCGTLYLVCCGRVGRVLLQMLWMCTTFSVIWGFGTIIMLEFQRRLFIFRFAANRISLLAYLWVYFRVLLGAF